MPAPNISTIRIAVAWPVTSIDARLDERVDRARGDQVGERDDRQRDRRRDRRAVDDQQQDQDQRAGDRQQRLVDALERRRLVGGERRLARDDGVVRDDAADRGHVALDHLGGVVAGLDGHQRDVALGRDRPDGRAGRARRCSPASRTPSAYGVITRTTSTAGPGAQIACASASIRVRSSAGQAARRAGRR